MVTAAITDLTIRRHRHRRIMAATVVTVDITGIRRHHPLRHRPVTVGITADTAAEAAITAAPIPATTLLAATIAAAIRTVATAAETIVPRLTVDTVAADPRPGSSFTIPRATGAGDRRM